MVATTNSSFTMVSTPKSTATEIRTTIINKKQHARFKWLLYGNDENKKKKEKHNNRKKYRRPKSWCEEKVMSEALAVSERSTPRIQHKRDPATGDTMIHVTGVAVVASARVPLDVTVQFRVPPLRAILNQIRQSRRWVIMQNRPWILPFSGIALYVLWVAITGITIFPNLYSLYFDGFVYFSLFWHAVLTLDENDYLWKCIQNNRRSNTEVISDIAYWMKTLWNDLPDGKIMLANAFFGQYMPIFAKLLSTAVQVLFPGHRAVLGYLHRDEYATWWTWQDTPPRAAAVLLLVALASWCIDLHYLHLYRLITFNTARHLGQLVMMAEHYSNVLDQNYDKLKRSGAELEQRRFELLMEKAKDRCKKEEALQRASGGVGVDESSTGALRIVHSARCLAIQAQLWWNDLQRRAIDLANAINEKISKKVLTNEELHAHLPRPEERQRARRLLAMRIALHAFTPCVLLAILIVYR